MVFFYFDFSLASHANYLRTLGCKACVGKENGAEKYHVRVVEEA